MQGSSIIFGSTKNICQKRIFHNAAMQNFVLTRCMSMKYKIAQIESRTICNNNLQKGTIHCWTLSDSGGVKIASKTSTPKCIVQVTHCVKSSVTRKAVVAQFCRHFLKIQTWCKRIKKSKPNTKKDQVYAI